MSTFAAQGRCLCGQVTLNVEAASTSIGACHCTMCRRWAGGGPVLMLDCGTAVSFDGEENISVYSSSDWAERGFCKQCGSNLFYRLKGSGACHISSGLFDQLPELEFKHQLFIDEKPAYYDFSNQTEKLTGQQVFEKFS